jgi:hypothetical protein
MSRSVAIGDGGTDDDITEQKGQFVLEVIGPFGPRSTGIGPATGRVTVTVDGERKDIGGTGRPHESCVEIGDRSLVHEHHRQFALALDTLIGECRKRQTLPTIEIDGHMGLFIGDEHRDVTVGRTAPSGPL